MNAQYLRSLFLFHRDLRCDDNCGLRAACAQSSEVLPTFILDPRQLEPHPFRSDAALPFLARCLLDLDAALRERGSQLYLFLGDPVSVLRKILAEVPFDAFFCNRDYTPFARKRDKSLAAWAKDSGVAFHVHRDILLTEPEEVRKSDGTPYTVYSAFAKKAGAVPIAAPLPLTKGVFFNEPITIQVRFEDCVNHYRLLPMPYRAGGRREGLQLLENLRLLDHYQSSRDIPADEKGTSGLSAHLKFGTVSPREVYARTTALFGANHLLVRELLWRDFFHHIAWHFPHVFEGAFHRGYDAISWQNEPAQFARWQEGSTGFPIVDAGMRQLSQSGYMHNRVRMIVASFLTKDLHIDWHWGERHFAHLLQDYDPSVNNGNWQWAASTGCDAQPYFRIFNPWLQQKKFDPECLYIKRWLPELRDIEPRTLHSLFEQANRPTMKYPAPMLDHAEARLGAEEMYAAVAKKG